MSKLIKGHLSQIIQSGEFLGDLLDKSSSLLMKVTSLGNNVLAQWATMKSGRLLQ